jgi:bifunctional oligoribonuclease and PAP phosphatase NrnA
MVTTPPPRLDPEHALALAADKVVAADKILLSCHLGPDGDSVGSMVALASLLRAQGKEATLYNPDLVPRRLKWMPLVKTWVNKLKPETRYQLTIVVDCGDPQLLGDSFPDADKTGEVVVLDHHTSVRPFGDLYVCDPAASSVGVLVARLAQRLGWPITADAAVGIYVSLISDTGSFRYSNTNAEALRLAAELVEGGLDPWFVTERMGERAPLSRYKLLALALETLETTHEGRIAFMTITKEMVKRTGSGWDETEGMVNYTRAIAGVECGVLLTPAKRGGTRVSMRSKGRLVDAGAVCEALGGGGHRGAAGCTVAAPLAEARAKIEEALAAALAAPPAP